MLEVHYKHLKNVLNHCISNLSAVYSIFCENPESDFTRNRKLTFETTLKDIICMESDSMNDYSLQTPTVSVFIQARSKFKVIRKLVKISIIKAIGCLLQTVVNY